MNDLDQTVIDLHDIARTIEQQMGVGDLSQDIRRCADRLNSLINYKCERPINEATMG